MLPLCAVLYREQIPALLKRRYGLTQQVGQRESPERGCLFLRRPAAPRSLKASGLPLWPVSHGVPARVDNFFPAVPLIFMLQSEKVQLGKIAFRTYA